MFVCVVGSLFGAYALWNRLPHTMIRGHCAEVCGAVAVSASVELARRSGWLAGWVPAPAWPALGVAAAAAVIVSAVDLGWNLDQMMVRLVRPEYLESAARPGQRWRARLLAPLAAAALYAADWLWLDGRYCQPAVAVLAAGALFVNGARGARIAWNVRQTAMRAPRPVRGPGDMKLAANQARFAAEICTAWLVLPYLAAITLHHLGRPTHQLPSIQGTSMHVKAVAFNSPESLNKISVAMGEEFERVMGSLAQDSALRAVVLTGAGKAFSAGGDFAFLAARASCSPAENRQEMLKFYSRFLSNTLCRFPVPVVSAVQGHAIGAGLCLTLATHARVVASQAKFAFNFTKIAIHPGMGATYFLPRLVGPSTAADLLLSGRTFSGLDAVRLGLASASADTPEGVMERATALAVEYADASPHAVRQVVESMRPDETALARALDREATAQASSYQTQEFSQWIKETVGR